MPVYREPWRDLDVRVARSIEAGMAAPAPLQQTSYGCAISAPACSRLTQTDRGAPWLTNKSDAGKGGAAPKTDAQDESEDRAQMAQAEGPSAGGRDLVAELEALCALTGGDLDAVRRASQDRCRLHS